MECEINNSSIFSKKNFSDLLILALLSNISSQIFYIFLFFYVLNIVEKIIIRKINL